MLSTEREVAILARIKTLEDCLREFIAPGGLTERQRSKAHAVLFEKETVKTNTAMPGNNVIELRNVTRWDLPPNRILDRVKEEAHLTSVVVMGWTDEGQEYFISSIADGGTVIWLLERLKLKLLT